MANQFSDLLDHDTLAPALPAGDADSMAAELSRVTDTDVYPRSLAAQQNSVFFLGRSRDGKLVGCVGRDRTSLPLDGETRKVTVDGVDCALVLARPTAQLAARMREYLPFLMPRTLGLQTSAGCGDRLGMATPGHIQGLRATFGDAPDSAITIAPIFAQQSIRENARTGRSPQEVVDDAMWGVFQEGWRNGYGADADHLKTLEDVDSCVAAGYSFYTVDPGEYVDDRANTASLSDLQSMVDALPWRELADTQADLVRRLTTEPIDLPGFTAKLSAEEVMRAAAKYGHALAHTLRMYRHLNEKADRFEFEMSVDETETITTLAEHIYIASELKRLGVDCVSLAPRYVGTFEKGVDYIGDLDAFRVSLQQHHAVALTYGPYKLSLHSGSDKFRVYPIAREVAGDLVHLKTAGTSYLEALRAIAAIDAHLFREIVGFARDRYPEDRASYHVSADLKEMPDIEQWPDHRLPELLDDFHAREILHVTFGSVLNHPSLSKPFFDVLQANEVVYDRVLSQHFRKHFAPFV